LLLVRPSIIFSPPNPTGELDGGIVRKFRIFLLMSALWLVGSCTATLADQIVLKNGDRLTGTITNSDTKSLFLKTEFAGDVTIQWQAIDTINSTQPLHVGLTGGQTVVGPVTTANGTLTIATQAAGTVSASKDNVQVIRSDSAQAAYDAELE